MAKSGRPRLRRFTSKKQSRFMFALHPKIAKRWANRMKSTNHTKHPIKPLPQYSPTPAARATRRRKNT